MNNYDNAEPKPLKFLVSDGKLVDESGNVIAESDSLQDLYVKSSPQVKKYLLSDGSVVDENNNLIIKNDYYKKVYDQATPKVAKYLHSDGTIDENPGGADLEENHQTTIDVSTYTEPVEVEPTSGKDGMKKNTVTLTNIPSGSANAYAWSTNDGLVYFPTNIAPTNKTDYLDKCAVEGVCNINTLNFYIETYANNDDEYTRVSDTQFSVSYESDGQTVTETFTRDATKDFTLWRVNE